MPKATEFAAPGGSICVKMPRWREHMRHPGSVSKYADYFITVVDAESDGIVSAGKIKLRERVATLHKGMGQSSGVIE